MLLEKYAMSTGSVYRGFAQGGANRVLRAVESTPGLGRHAAALRANYGSRGLGGGALSSVQERVRGIVGGLPRSGPATGSALSNLKQHISETLGVRSV